MPIIRCEGRRSPAALRSPGGGRSADGGGGNATPPVAAAGLGQLPGRGSGGGLRAEPSGLAPESAEPQVSGKCAEGLEGSRCRSGRPVAAAAPRRIRASTPLVHHPLGEGNLDVVLLEGVQDLPAQLTEYAEIGQPTSRPRPRCGGGRRRLRGDHRGGGSELLQACDEFRGVVSPTHLGGSAFKATSGLDCAEPGLLLEPEARAPERNPITMWQDKINLRAR